MDEPDKDVTMTKLEMTQWLVDDMHKTHAESNDGCTLSCIESCVGCSRAGW